MTTIKINFNDLHDAAKKANKAADEMRSYADSLPKVVNNRLASLTGGSSSYTSSAAGLATQKQSQLRRRADAYVSMGHNIDTFVNAAKQVDDQVKRRLEAEADKRAGNLGLWEKAGYYLYKAFNHTFGSSEAGAFVGNLLDGASAIVEKLHEVGEVIKDWFVHGAGKYVLNIALAGLAIVGTVVGVILTFPVSGVLATIVAVATVIAAVVTVADSIAKIISNAKALSKNSTEPGQARYHGNVSDATSFAEKNFTDSRLHSAARIFDFTGKVAGVVSFVAGMGVTRAADGTNIGKLDKDTILGNIGSKFGFKYDVDELHWKFNPGDILGLTPGKHVSVHDSSISGVTKANPAKWFYNAETVRNWVTPTTNSLKLFSESLKFNGHFDGFKDVKSVTSITGTVMPGLKGIDKVLGFGEDVYDVITYEPSTAHKTFASISVGGGGGFRGR